MSSLVETNVSWLKEYFINLHGSNIVENVEISLPTYDIFDEWISSYMLTSEATYLIAWSKTRELWRKIDYQWTWKDENGVTIHEYVQGYQFSEKFFEKIARNLHVQGAGVGVIGFDN